MSWDELGHVARGTCMRLYEKGQVRMSQGLGLVCALYVKGQVGIS